MIDASKLTGVEMSLLALGGCVAVLGLIVGSLLWARRLSSDRPEPIWDWDELESELDAVLFSPDFLWGTATAAHQVEGGHTANNWARWEQDPGPDGKGRIQNGDVAGDACRHWDLYEADLDREEFGD